MSSQSQPRPIISYPCQVCGTPTSNWCSRCISVWYCSEDHLKQVCPSSPSFSLFALSLVLRLRVIHASLYSLFSSSGLAQPPCLLHPGLPLSLVLPLVHLALRPRLVGPILRPPVPRGRGPPEDCSRILLRCPAADQGNPHHRSKPPVPMGSRRQTVAPRGQPVFRRPHTGPQRRASPIPTPFILHPRRPRQGHPHQPLYFQTHKRPSSPKVEWHGALFKYLTLIISITPTHSPIYPSPIPPVYPLPSSPSSFHSLPAHSQSIFFFHRLHRPFRPPPLRRRTHQSINLIPVPDLISYSFYSRSSPSNTVAPAARHTRTAQPTTSRRSCPISCPSHDTCPFPRAYFGQGGRLSSPAWPRCTHIRTFFSTTTTTRHSREIQLYILTITMQQQQQVAAK